MADEFDPYHRWLGIPPKDQPPNHYRLLAIEVFEADSEVIVDAVQRQVAHVRTYHLGPLADLSQKILNEIAAAKACLLDPKKKAAYDARLREKLPKAQPPVARPEQLRRTGDPRLDQFIQHLVQSGLMSPIDIFSFYDGFPRNERPKDAQSFARELCKAGKLTKYQAETVFQGKTKGLVFGEYWVLGKLGEGGMGVVLKAEHRRMKRVVAVKTISGVTLKSPDAVKRFYREVEAAAKLNHPNIVTAYDASEQDGIHYLVMEYVEGKDLSVIVKEKGSLPVAQAVDYIIQAARGLQYAHKQKIIHRDIKPANLLLDKEGTVKILDMGLARVAGLADQDDKDRLTASGQVMGTCDYMAPEQALDTHHVDARADIYSLGCTLYRLLVGDAMYQGETLAKILISHQMAPVPSLCKVRSAVPSQLDAVFQKMVAKRPEDRYQSMTEVISALEASIGKSAATATSFGEGAAATFPAQADLSVLPGAPPPVVATAAKKKVEKLAAATIAHHAAAAETSKQLGSDEKPLAVWRKKEAHVVAIGLGLLGVIGLIAWAVTIHVRHPDGKETSVTVPNGSSVTVNGKGDVGVTLPNNSPRPIAGDDQGIRGDRRLASISRGSGDRPRTAGALSGVRKSAAPVTAPVNTTTAKQQQEALAKHLGVPVEQTNSIGMNLVLIPPGKFEMGSTPEEIAWAVAQGRKSNEPQAYLDRVSGEGPRHPVKITKPFWLGKCPVSQKEFSFVMGFNPSTYAATGTKKTAVHGGDTSRYPVETVSWEDAVEFCRQLSALPEEVEAWRTYRLPTEAEWEYACRAGTTTRWWCGNDEAGLEGAAWYDKNADGIPHPLGEKQSNAWHLCDMHGNVWQWCADWFSADYYRQSAPNDPAGPPTGSLRALRGGDFSSGAWKCRSASRDGSAIASRGERHGFRVVLERKAE